MNVKVFGPPVLAAVFLAIALVALWAGQGVAAHEAPEGAEQPAAITRLEAVQRAIKAVELFDLATEPLASVAALRAASTDVVLAAERGLLLRARLVEMTADSYTPADFVMAAVWELWGCTATIANATHGVPAPAQ